MLLDRPIYLVGSGGEFGAVDADQLLHEGAGGSVDVVVGLY